jgi:hypothetical protein
MAVRRRVPDLDRAEVRQVRCGISDAGQNGHLSCLPQRLQGRQRRMNRWRPVPAQNHIGFQREARAQIEVETVIDRYDCIQAVVATAQFDQHQQARGLGARPGRQSRCRQQNRGVAEKSAAIHRVPLFELVRRVEQDGPQRVEPERAFARRSARCDDEQSLLESRAGVGRCNAFRREPHTCQPCRAVDSG